MNNDLISREALLERIEQVQLRIKSIVDASIFNGLRSIVERTPAVETTPLKLGKWLPNGDDVMDAGMWHCSECGHEIYSDLALIEEIQEQGYALYCEHCGAKMGGSD